MNIKNIIKRIPFTVDAYRKLAALRNSLLNARILDQLKSSHHPKAREIRVVLLSLPRRLSQSDQAWIDRIETQRKLLLNRNEPLDDGSFAEAGLYDEGVSVRRACQVSKGPEPARLLFLLARDTMPRTVLELGTNVGISSAYVGAGMKANGQSGRIITLDASPYRQRLAMELHSNIGIDNVTYVKGLFTDTLHETLTGLGSIDLAFIDGHHQYQPTLDYFEAILKQSAPDAIFIFDDIRWSDGMKKAWAKIQSDDRLGLVLDLGSVGICTRIVEGDSQRFVSDMMRLF
jgi:predicted O-methyltransferase YrrM